jgi:CubicO group peptidase (beta-lactamase class C family)
VLIAKNGKPILERAYGLASKGFNIPNRTDTKFNLASMNKMFTAVAIAQLAEQGKLSFDDTILKHLPDYPNRSVAERVTIHQLLTHTSGLGDFFNEKFEQRKTRLRSVQDHFPLFVNDPLLFEPGQKWRYSNAGFIVLGAIIEKLSGQNYFDYVRDHIYKPAGMLNTDSYETDREVVNRATGYTEIGPTNRAEPGPLRNNLMINPVKGSPAGGGYSTVEDMLRFNAALLHHKLLSEKFTVLVLTGKVEVGPPNEKYGYGFMESQTNGTRIVGHGGTSPGANTKFDMYPEAGYTVIVLANYDPRAAERVADRFRERITRK